MNALHFGASVRPLFGVYHPPTRRPIRPDGVVVCNPFGLEYMRVHLTLTSLARELADAGHHVLRFDYHGTGDSGGDGTQPDLRGWLWDVEVAAEELQAISGVSAVSLVGVRLGGSLALMAAGRLDVASVAVWDPVVRGRRYLAELIQWSRRPAADAGAESVKTDLEVLGYPFPGSLRRELDGLDVCDAHIGRARVGFFLSDRGQGTDALLEQLRRRGPEPTVLEVYDPGVWNDPRRFGTAVLAPGVVRGVTTWLS